MTAHFSGLVEILQCKVAGSDSLNLPCKRLIDIISVIHQENKKACSQPLLNY